MMGVSNKYYFGSPLRVPDTRLGKDKINTSND